MMMPPTMPMTIEPMVPMMVPFQSPSITGVCCMISRALAKFQRGFVTNELMSMARTTRITTSATQRPGCRTGLAEMTPGRSVVAPVGVAVVFVPVTGSLTG